MPAINRGMFLQLSLLLLIVPAQYFLTQWKPTTTAQRNTEVQHLMTRLHVWQTKLTSAHWWQQRGRNAWHTMADFFNHFEQYGEKILYGGPVQDDEVFEGESPAIEVLKYRESDGYFGGSTEKRSPRPRHVKFRIGQVVRHKEMGYRGVIVGWDVIAKAPASWIKEHIPPDKQYSLKQPCYAILLDDRDILSPMSLTIYVAEEDVEALLVDTDHYIKQPNYMLLVNRRDSQSFRTAYITEELLQSIANNKIENEQIEEYFEAFDGSRYLARPWLKKVYPHDQ